MMKQNAIFLLFFILLVFGFISCDKEISTSPREKDIVRVNKRLVVNTSPPGAMIYIDGKITGLTTPDTVEWLESSSFEITLKKQYLKDTSLFISLTGNISTVDVDYYKNQSMYASIFVTSEPLGALILIDDSLTGYQTPKLFEKIFPGKHKISCRYPNCRDSYFTTGFRYGVDYRRDFVMQDTTVWIDFLTENSEIPEDNITSLEIGNNNLLYIGTASKGIASFNGKDWYNFDNSPVASMEITDLEFDVNNMLWIGSLEGVFCFDGYNWQHFSESNSSLPDNYIYRIKSDNKSNVWIATENGIARYNNGSLEVESINLPEFRNKQIRDIAITSSNEIWIVANYVGLFKYSGNWTKIDPQVWKNNYPYIQGMPYLTSEDPNGNIWVYFLQNSSGFGGGLIKFMSENNFLDQPYPQTGIINSLFVDDSDNAWFGTSEGLKKVRKGKAPEYFNAKNSILKSDFVFDVIKDKNNHIWIATDKGLVKYKGND